MARARYGKVFVASGYPREFPDVSQVPALLIVPEGNTAPGRTPEEIAVAAPDLACAGIGAPTQADSLKQSGDEMPTRVRRTTAPTILQIAGLTVGSVA